ncbi:uncharacterized protein LOC126353852 isoform X3 [Schistocerca gregaria]|uniref:uncharacterized protein LOC126353852 isoform X3 n=1 Tax=Schistocerca gregaria TaxID=7010 RepID=UPI00211F3C63|nr:uncharacterized protein LOC126353852 isoform X3 [Schistocerca gregaria]
MIAEGKTFFLRSAVFVGLASVVTTIIYFTPVPDIEFASCERPCHELDWPMICRVKLTVEVYQPLTSSCGSCPSNVTDCFRPQCITADGVRQPMLTVNRQLPGPTIHVCENDILLVELENRAPGVELSVHWRGQPQRETPAMDGVAGVTQCAVPAHTTFQYKFRAAAPGTHLWHAFTGLTAADTVSGALVVRRPESKESLRPLYDRDERDHLVLVSQLAEAPATLLPPGADAAGRALLINGRQQGSGDLPLHTFWVSAGRRYRFRVVNAGGGGHCAVNVTVEGHRMLLVALDGAPVKPQLATSAVLASGERADVVIRAEHADGTYRVLANTVPGCGSRQLNSAALLRYRDPASDDRDRDHDEVETNSIDGDGVGLEKPSPAPPTELAVEHSEEPETAPFNVTVWTWPRSECESDAGVHVCLQQVRGDHELPEALASSELPLRLLLPFGRDQRDQATGATRQVGGVSFAPPPSPLLTQPDDVPTEAVCAADVDSSATLETPAPRSGCPQDQPCRCVHVRRVPLGSALEIVLVNQDDSDSTIHVHGNPGYVVATAEVPVGTPAEAVAALLRPRLQLRQPPLKDTVHVPARSAVALRLVADNPGYWLIHDQRPSHWTAGLAVLLQVGSSSDVTNVPSDFPRCGSWVGPEFLLI